MGELLKQYPGRPSIIIHEGCRVYVSIHDAYYKATLTSWKKKLKAAHPDTINGSLIRYGGTSGIKALRPRSPHQMAQGRAFRIVARSYRAWVRAELKWYAQYDLDIPEYSIV